MAPKAEPPLSLTVQPSTDKGRTAYTSTALGLAGAFHREFSCCTNDAERRKVCQSYRDKILSISQFAEVTATAFHAAFPQFLRESSRGEDARAWTSFASLVQRQRKSQNRGAQLLQLQTSVVAIWGEAVFTHYGWRELPLDSTKLLHSVASKLPDWNFAVKAINNTLIERHERRVVKHDNRAQRIGEHSRCSKIQNHHSPVEPRDLEIILSRFEDGELQMSSQPAHTQPTYTIDGTPIRDHGLKRDRFSMIVPDGMPGVERKSSSPSRQANKRRRGERNVFENSAEPEESQLRTSRDQPTPRSACTTDSEMTEFVEEGPNGSPDAGMGSVALTRMDEDDLQSSTSDAESQPPEASVRETRNPSRTSPFQSVRASPCTAYDPDPKTTPLRTDSTLVEERPEDNDDQTRMSMTDLKATTLQVSTESSDQEGDSRCEYKTTDAECQNKNPLEESTSLVEDSDHSPLDVVDRPCEAVSAGEYCQTSPLHEQEPPAVQHTNVTVRNQQEYTSDEDIQPDNESEAAITNSNDVAALETVASMFKRHRSLPPKTCSRRNQSIEPALLQQKMSEGSTLTSEAFPLPDADGRCIPASTERPKARYCTTIDVDNDDTVVGRMASRNAYRLREILDIARKRRDDHHIREQNEIKANWLEKTQWANVYAAPNDLDPTLQLPLDADVWYMDWETFQRRAEGGEIFHRPIVIRQVFQDSGMYSPHEFIALLRERFPEQKIDMQNSETGECMGEPVTHSLATCVESERADFEGSSSSDNAINLRRIANADAPLLTRLKRFRLLETLVDRVSNLAPGKRTCRETYDISDCLGFDLLGSTGAFSRPHVDSLVGTWIRCLSGSKAWIFAPSMSDKDWNDFAQGGTKWSPGDKGRVIILEKDDVLLMPPGVRLLHAVFTLETSLMEGGMLWDECNIPQLLDELLWVGKNQSCTNEAIAYQLPGIIDSLETWIQENGTRLSTIVQSPGYVARVKEGIKNLRTLGCKCPRRCDTKGGCCCSTQGRRCTTWCSKHPAFPSQTAGQVRCCMHEG